MRRPLPLLLVVACLLAGTVFWSPRATAQTASTGTATTTIAISPALISPPVTGAGTATVPLPAGVTGSTGSTVTTTTPADTSGTPDSGAPADRASVGTIDMPIVRDNAAPSESGQSNNGGDTGGSKNASPLGALLTP